MIKKFTFLIFTFIFLIGVSANFVNAQTSTPASSVTCSVTNIGGLLCKFQQILNSALPVLLALGSVYFVWGVITYVINDNEEAKKKGRDRIIYGIIGFTVIIGLWGLVNIVINTFGIGGASAPSLSTLTTTPTSSTCSLEGSPKFQDLLCYITKIINNSVIPLIFAIAAVTFVWGVVQFVINNDEEAKKEKGKQFMIWGIIALTVMVGVWGLVGILGNTFGLNTTLLPQVHPPGTGSNSSTSSGLCPDGSYNCE